MHQLKYILPFVALFVLSCAPKMAKETADTQKGTDKTDFRATAPKPGPARDIEIGKSSHFTLGNGLTVIVVENHKIPEISYQLTIDRDPILEKQKSGVSSMTGSLLATGTTTKSKAEIDEAVDYIGANLSTNERGGFASSLTKHTDKILALFSDVIQNPSFPQTEFDKIKNQTLSGLQTQKDNPTAISNNVSSALIYGKDHPYGEITSEITVSNITLDDCRQNYMENFKPGSAYLVIVGDISPDAAKTKAEKYFGRWTGGMTEKHMYTAPKEVSKTSVAFVDKPGAVQSVINITYPVDLKPGSPDDIPGRVMNTILGSGFSGRLFKNLREDKAYTYGAYSALNTDRLVGSFSANASVRNEVTDSAVTQFLLELNKLRDESVQPKELELSKSFIAGGFARSLENPQTVANFALNTLRYHLPEDYYATYLKRLSAVSVDDVNRMAKKYITPDKARIIVVGNKDEVMDKLKVFDKDDGKVDLYDIYANPRKDDSNMKVDVEGIKVVEAYLDAIGGRDKLSGVTGMDQTFTTDLMGTPITARTVQDQGKFYMNMNAQGMDFVKQIYDGNKGMVEQMGQKVPAEGDDLDNMKEQATLFPERLYGGNDYKLEVTGVEDINGKPAYKLQVTKPDGKKVTEFYDKESHYKVREIRVETQEGQTATQTFDFGDYQTVDGVAVPHKVTITGGGMPAPMVMKMTSVKVNPQVDPGLFKI